MGTTKSPLIDLRINLPDRLKSLRLQRAMNQQQMAKLLGVTNSTYSAWERGFRYPRMDEINRVAAVLGLTASGLLGTHYNEKMFAEEPLVIKTGDFILTQSDSFIHAKNFDDVLPSAKRITLPWLNLPGNQNYFIYKMRDAAMSSPDLKSIAIDSLCVINSNVKMTELTGKVHLVSIERGNAILRQVFINPQDATAKFVAWNPDYAEKTVPQNLVQIWGTVEFTVQAFNGNAD